MLIAVASRDGKTVSGHIGKCADWILYEAEKSCNDEPPLVRELERVTLPKQFIFHHYRDETPHPFADCTAVIGASAGESFKARMQARGIEAAMTAETSPEKAVSDYVRQSLTPPKPRPIGEIICKIHDALSSGS